MTNEMMHTALIVCTSVLFVTAAIVGVAAWAAANAWLQNRREAREAQEDRAKKRKEQERENWTEVLRERDERIISLQMELERMRTLSDIADRLLKVSEMKRIDDAKEGAGMKSSLRWNIRSAMDRLDISPAEMAAALEIKEPTYYWRMRDPERRMSVADIMTIARKCDTTAAWLISGTPAQR